MLSGKFRYEKQEWRKIRSIIILIKSFAYINGAIHTPKFCAKTKLIFLVIKILIPLKKY